MPENDESKFTPEQQAQAPDSAEAERSAENRKIEQQTIDAIRDNTNAKRVRLRIAEELARSQNSWFALFRSDLVVAMSLINARAEQTGEIRYRIAFNLIKELAKTVTELQRADGSAYYDPDVPPKDVRAAFIDNLEKIGKIAIGEEVAEPYKK